MHFISILIKALPEIKTLLQPVMKRGILLAIHTKLVNNPRSSALAFIGWDRGLRQHFTAKDSILMSSVENVKCFKTFTPDSILHQYDNRSRPGFSLREAETLNFITREWTTQTDRREDKKNPGPIVIAKHDHTRTPRCYVCTMYSVHYLENV